MSFTLTRIAMHAAALTTVALGVVLGPPQISVRQVGAGVPAPAGAVLLIETQHHNDIADLSLTGRAEGLVNGKRVSNTLQFTRQSVGHYSLTRQWQAGTPWVLVLAAEQGPDGKHGVAEAIVKVSESGAVTGTDYPAAGWIDRSDTPKRTSTTAIDAMLASMVVRR